jgi:iron complex transport system ATP-binding protein
VRQVVELGRYALPPRPARIEEVLEEMELRALADRPWLELSAGQQQRVTLARALAQLEPGGHLVLDEPVSAMDLAHVATVARALRDRVAGGATVLASLHDVTLASALAGHAWVLSEGRVVGAGPAAEVLTAEVLEPVFAVRFRQVDLGQGRPLLVPEPPAVR